MNQRRTIYLFISTTMVFVYLLLYALLYKPSTVNAQAACFQLTLESCQGAGCLPGCIGVATPATGALTGYTPGPYGVPVNSIICKE